MWMLLYLAKRKQRSFDPVKARHRRGLLRAIAYIAFASAGISTYAYASTKSELGNKSIRFGRDLAPIADLIKEPTQIVMNGESIHVSASLVEDSPTSILERLEKACADAHAPSWPSSANANANSNASANANATANATAPTSIQTFGDRIFGTFRTIRAGRGDYEGVVSCIAPGARTEKHFLDAAKVFAETGDFGALGKLRYAYVKRVSERQSMITFAWTEDSFSIDKLVSKDGSEPPGEPKDLPRPDSSRALMHVSLTGTQYGAHVYRSASQPEELLKTYEEKMQRTGWENVMPTDVHDAMAFYKNGAEVIVSAHHENGETLFTVSELRAP